MERLKRIACLMLALLMFVCCLSAVAEGFSDVGSSHWAKYDIDWAADRGLMQGIGGGKFGPEVAVSRAMLVTVLWRMEGEPTGNPRAPFVDVSNIDWYTYAVDWAYQNRIVSGTAPTKFSPGGNLSREQAAAILYRYSEYVGRDTSDRASLATFPDASKVSSWAKEALSWANAEGLITGAVVNNRTVLNPQGNTTRAQLASIMRRYILGGPIPVEPFVENPLLAENKPVNCYTEPSINIDQTGFSSVPLGELKGKALVMVTDGMASNFVYRGPNGEMLTEWDWFDSVKKAYGLAVKTIECRVDRMPQLIITYLNSGKALDLFQTCRACFPQHFALSGGLNDYINEDYIDNSPGIDKNTLEQTKWDGQYRCIAPRGAVDVIWYNETMVKSFGLSDPHTLWEWGEWDWEAWRSFMVDVPKRSPDETQLCPFSMSEGDAWSYWARANGVNAFEIQTTNGKSKIVSNFSDFRCHEAWVFYTDVFKGVEAINRRGSSTPQVDMYRDGSCIMASTQYLMKDYSGSEMKYAKSHKYNWVPYPTKSGKGICMNYGVTMMLPKWNNFAENIPYAVKFAELWATRFTEAMNDYLQQPYYDFSYQERMEYFDYASKNSYFAVGTRIFDLLSGNDREYYYRFLWSFYNPTWDTATQAEQLIPLAERAANLMAYYSG